MSKKKVMIVFGTRPEAIKMAPLVKCLKESPERFEIKICVTAQHRHMLDQVLTFFNIIPDIDLNVMLPNQDLATITSNILIGINKIFKTYKPDIVLVHGDTTTTLSTAMAAFYNNIKLGHVEAGLRTNDLFAPFPEEFNRQIVSKLAFKNFAPTDLSRRNLLSEGYQSENIHVTGNTVIDALFLTIERIETNKSRLKTIRSFFKRTLSFSFTEKRFVLITGHRRENFGKGFLEICQAIRELALKFRDTHFVYPVHLNPMVQDPVKNILSDFSNVHLIQPLDYEKFVYLLKYSYIVLTDSGGIQEEAPSLGKPVLVMRNKTERPEAVVAGTVKLVGADKEQIAFNITKLLEHEDIYLKMSTAHNPYGDGKSSKRIVEIIKNM